jgi:hypothetical protein
MTRRHYGIRYPRRALPPLVQTALVHGAATPSNTTTSAPHDRPRNPSTVEERGRLYSMTVRGPEALDQRRAGGTPTPAQVRVLHGALVRS